MVSTILLALVTGLPATITAIGTLWIGIRNSRKLTTVHTLVNSRLSTALAEIDTLKGTVSSMQTAKDVRDAKDGPSP